MDKKDPYAQSGWNWAKQPDQQQRDQQQQEQQSSEQSRSTDQQWPQQQQWLQQPPPPQPYYTNAPGLTNGQFGNQPNSPPPNQYPSPYPYSGPPTQYGSAPPYNGPPPQYGSAPPYNGPPPPYGYAQYPYPPHPSYHQPPNYQPYGEYAGAPYAGFWIRVVAALVDGLVVGIIYLLFALVALRELDLVAIELVFYVVTYSYSIFMHKAYGQTLGKMALRIRVIRHDGRELDWGTVILRELPGKILSGLTLYVGYMLAGFTREKKGLHDMIAGTRVIKIR